MGDNLVQALRAIHEQIQLPIIDFSLPLTLDEVYQHIIERVQLIVGESIDPATDNTRELYLVGGIAVDELEDVEDRDVLDEVLLVLPAG